MSAPNVAPSLARLVARAQQLYTLPAVALRVLELTGDQQVDSNSLKSCLEKDPALAAKVLRVVNSSLFGVTTQVGDLNQALALLGLKPLQLLVLSFSLPPDLCQSGNTEALLGYWRHALTKAVAAREIASRWLTYPPDEAFLAALLQDIGILVLVKELGAPYSAFLQRVMAEQADLAAVELTTLGFDHTVLSARLLDQWRLPATLVRAVAVPHDTAWIASLPSNNRRLPQILHLAELLALMLARQRPRVLPQFLEVARKYAALVPTEVDRLVDSLEPTVDELAQLLKFPLNAGTSYKEILADAHARLAELNEEVALDLMRKRQHGQEQLWNETRELALAVEAATRLPIEAALPTTSKSDPRATTAAELSPALLRSAAPAATLAPDTEQKLASLLTTAIARARQERMPVSLVLLEVEGYGELAITRGPEGGEQVMRFLHTACRVACENPEAGLRLNDSRLGLVLPGWDRAKALEAGRSLIKAMERVSREGATGGQPIKLSIGLVTSVLPAPNLRADALQEAAERCLYGAKAAGGSALKSLEIC